MKLISATICMLVSRPFITRMIKIKNLKGSRDRRDSQEIAK